MNTFPAEYAEEAEYAEFYSNTCQFADHYKHSRLVVNSAYSAASSAGSAGNVFMSMDLLSLK